MLNVLPISLFNQSVNNYSPVPFSRLGTYRLQQLLGQDGPPECLADER